MERVVLGLSGGVDSAVAGKLLQQQGYLVHGVYLDNGTAQARQDAMDTARQLGIELQIVPVAQLLEEQVCRPFAQGYVEGRTINPCILCNPTVKFPALLARAQQLGVQYIASGLYARTQAGGLSCGHPSNDQSYLLSRLTREQAARLLLPLGALDKAQVRQLAQDFGIAVARKPDSMEICFIPDRDYCGWLERRGAQPPAGEFRFRDRVLGTHDGIHRYTVGQRYGELLEGRRLYVKRIDPHSGCITLGLWEELFTCRVRASQVQWLADVPTVFRGSVRARHTRWEMPTATITITGPDTILVETDTSLRAPAPGQTLAIYDGERVLGSGIIEQQEEE